MSDEKQLTAQEIDAMEAGPHVDDLVARRVMGWKHGKRGVSAGLWVDSAGRKMGWNTGPSAWSSSTNNASMIEVVNWMKNTHNVHIEWFGESWRANFTKRETGVPTVYNWRNNAEHLSLSLAITRAALKTTLSN